MKGTRSPSARNIPSGYVRKNRTPKVAELLARDIVNYIIEEKLEEGARLPSERQMLKETGRARSTLREALRLLETRGVVEMRQGVDGGPIVSRPNAADLGEALSLILTFEGASMLDVIEARKEMEVLAVGRAISRLTDEHLQLLQETVERQASHINNRHIFLQESRQFHSIIYRASASRVMSILNEALQMTTHVNVEALEYSMKHRQDVTRAHQSILIALREGNSKKACNAMRSHVCDAGDYWQKVAGPMAKRRIRWP